MEFFEKTEKREDIFSGRVFEIHKDEVVLSDGTRAFREVVEHSGGVCVAAVDENKNILLVKQYRYPLKKVTVEVPAGKLEPSEDPMDAAIRELSEETGYDAGKLIKVGTFLSSPGFCSEKLHFYLATDLIPGKQHLDDGELLRCIKIPLQQAVDMVLSDEIDDGKTKALILLADKIVNE